MLKVRKTQCQTCIFRPGGPYSDATPQLVKSCRDQYGFLVQFRLCHSHHDLCCRGFYDQHGAACTPLQIATRLGLIEFRNDSPQRLSLDDDPEQPEDLSCDK